jgi:hypothetical protein
MMITGNDMKHDDGEPKSMNNDFTDHIRNKRDSVAMSYQQSAKNAVITSAYVEKERLKGVAVGTIQGLNKNTDFLAPKRMHVYSKA